MCRCSHGTAAIIRISRVDRRWYRASTPRAWPRNVACSHASQGTRLCRARGCKSTRRPSTGKLASVCSSVAVNSSAGDPAAGARGLTVAGFRPGPRSTRLSSVRSSITSAKESESMTLAWLPAQKRSCGARYQARPCQLLETMSRFSWHHDGQHVDDTGGLVTAVSLNFTVVATW